MFSKNTCACVFSFG
ncbi:MAG: hypothetical protein EAZ31_05320 [Cytophagia bacterium]|nr:MAG: hypothetical protein EAZ31_05320 [Cytophagia bacterium]